MNAHFGAHEMMEVHEILSNSINAINQCSLLRQQIQCQQLGSIVDKQLQFMTQEYNNLVDAVNERGINASSPYRSSENQVPAYGLNNPPNQSPSMSATQIQDKDIAAIVLGIHKSGATFRMIGSLECADPQLRRMVQQGAMNCAEQAYEVWQYMNQQGYYQVPTMKEMTTETLAQSYSTTSTPAMQNEMRQMRTAMSNATNMMNMQ